MEIPEEEGHRKRRSFLSGSRDTPSRHKLLLHREKDHKLMRRSYGYYFELQAPLTQKVPVE